ncbi:5'-3' exoribonuclease 1 [Globisporangium polare]
MGIPRFYRYMSERYPLINQPISDVSLLPEFDAFYLDMNGIIHNCTHSDGGDADALSTLGLAAQLHNIFTYMDRLITHIIKPKQIVYIAIDGVAPRAKLNQQRSRRFRAGLERQEALEKEQYLQIKLEDEKNGHRREQAQDKFDSNCITPGTEFLEQLSHHLVYFVRQKMKTDPLWARLEVFFSGAEVPGEGEHKIVEFIRHRKMLPGYGANVRHCMYGSDADLMLLGLMTHEPHFTLVREVVVWGSHKIKVVAKQIEEQQWQLVHLSLFREYLMMEMRVTAPLDGERMLDDFILLTFLLGNDFIPHSPTLEISEDAIPLLLQVYRELLEKHQGLYLTENGKLININMLQELFEVIGSQEEDILTNRAIEESKKKHRGGPRGGRNERPVATHDVDEDAVQSAILALNDSDEDILPPLLDDDGDDDEEDDEDDDDEEKALLEALDGELETKLALEVEEDKHQLFAELSGSQNFQETKWGYYERKFRLVRGDGNAHNKGLDEIKKHYVEALMWCIAYYFQGPPSWSWFYPYHYAPMVSDLTNIAGIAAKIKFKNDPKTDGPLLPFEQLMSNLPSTSAHLVPEPYRFLMVSPLSPIKHFYPETFDIDMEGKRNAWEGVNILPFIDVALLKQAIAQYCPDSRLSQSERRRNTLKMEPLRIVLDPSVVDTLPSSLPGVPGFPDVPLCNTRVENFKLPPIAVHGGQFQSRLMVGVQLPLAGFPSLYTVPLDAVRIEHVRLNCFGMASRKATLILQVPPSATIGTDVAPQDLISKTVLVNWPNLHEALVVGVSTLSGEFRRKKNAKGRKEVIFTPYEQDEKTSWAYYAQSEVVKLLAGRGVPGSGGIDLGKTGITTVLHVLPLQGMVSNPLTGAIEKKFGDVEALVPFQLAVVNRQLHDDRFQETGKLPLAERFPPTSVALITHGEWLGCTAVVAECDEDEDEVKVRVNTIDKEPPFGYVVAEKIVDKYFPGYLVAQKLGISPTTLGVLTGNVNVKPGDHDIGLNIRFRKDLLLPGYCRLVSRQSSGHKDASEEMNVWRKGDIVKIVGSGEYDSALKREPKSQSQHGGGNGAGNGAGGNASNMVWEYSERAVKLLAAYKAEFPGVVAKLDKLPFGTSYSGKDLFGVSDGKQIEVKAELVKVWIEQQHLGSKEHSKHIPVSSEYLSLSAIRAVEAAGALRATERQKHAAQNQVSPVEAVISAHHLFRPNPLVNQDLTGSEVSKRATKNPGAPRLGDRIINISGRGIPFGHRGTVVATHVSSKCIEVLFDEKFTGGEPLYGTVSLDRGKIVPWNNVICVSTPLGNQGPRSAASVDASHQQYASNNGLPRANDGSVKILAKNNKNDAGRKKKKNNRRDNNNNDSGPRVSSNSGMPAVPPPPPIPSSLPPPPDAGKMQMLLEKWSGVEFTPSSGPAEASAKLSPKPKSPKKPTKTERSHRKKVATPAANPEIAPSVMAFFSAAQASGVDAPPAPQPSAPAPDAVMNLFPHNYAGAPGAHSLMTPPPPPVPYGGHQGFVPHLLVPQAMAPPLPPHPHAFINPYSQSLPPGAPGYMLHGGTPQPAYIPAQHQQHVAPPHEPKLSEAEYPTLLAAATQTSKKTVVTVKPAADSAASAVTITSSSTTTTSSTSSRRKQTPKNRKSGDAEKVWVPKTATETKAPAKPSGLHLLLPSQVLRQQQKPAPVQQ